MRSGRPVSISERSSKDEVEGAVELKSRWGIDDERGAANLIDQAATLRAVSCVRTGEVVPLAIPIANGDRGPAADMRSPPQYFMTRDGGDYAAGLSERSGYGYSDDVLMVPTHGTTHIDALAHVWRDGLMYNQFKATNVTSRGAARCGIDKLGPIVTRAIFVDFAALADAPPDRAITAKELIDAVHNTGIKPESGDALVVRTGWLKAWRAGMAGKTISAGLHHDCARMDRGNRFCARGRGQYRRGSDAFARYRLRDAASHFANARQRRLFSGIAGSRGFGDARPADIHARDCAVADQGRRRQSDYPGRSAVIC